MNLVTNKCRLCSGEIVPVIDFGKMPIANGFIDKKDLDKEYFFNLSAAYCVECSLFQLIEMPDPKILFSANYAYHSGESNSMQQHFKEISDFTITSSINTVSCSACKYLSDFLSSRCNNSSSLKRAIEQFFVVVSIANIKIINNHNND